MRLGQDINTQGNVTVSRPTRVMRWRRIVLNRSNAAVKNRQHLPIAMTGDAMAASSLFSYTRRRILERWRRSHASAVTPIFVALAFEDVMF